MKDFTNRQTKKKIWEKPESNQIKSKTVLGLKKTMHSKLRNSVMTIWRKVGQEVPVGPKVVQKLRLSNKRADWRVR